MKFSHEMMREIESKQGVTVKNLRKSYLKNEHLGDYKKYSIQIN